MTDPHPDDKLLALGRKADRLRRKMFAWAAQPQERTNEEWNAWHDALRPIEIEIASTKAKTMDGVRVKVLVVAWCVGDDPMNDIDPIECFDEGMTTDVATSLSLVRDLIQMEGLAPGGPGWAALRRELKL